VPLLECLLHGFAGTRCMSSLKFRAHKTIMQPPHFSPQGGRKLADWGEKPRDVATGGAAAVCDEDGEVQAAIAASLADAPAAGAASFPSPSFQRCPQQCGLAGCAGTASLRSSYHIFLRVRGGSVVLGDGRQFNSMFSCCATRRDTRLRHQ
jgi:hypothetical protein